MTLNIAHRGFSRLHPENTMAAFEAAIDVGADMIELDVTLTADGHLVCIHDDTLSRTTDGDGFVCHQTVDQLDALDAGGWFGRQDRPHVPMLDLVLEEIAPRVPLNIEIKPFFPLARAFELEQAMQAMVRKIEQQGLLESTIFSSVNFFLLECLRSISPKLKIALIYRRPLTDYEPVDVCAMLGAWSLHPFHEQLDARMLDRLHDAGVKVFPYTIDEPETMRSMLALGVDGMFTNSPDVLRAEIEAWAR